jgi:hypothetical protein
MPKFLETKLKREYGENSAVPFKVMNSIGVMKGNKETEKGREMEKKHEEDKAMKKPSMTSTPMHELRVEIHRGKPSKSMPEGEITGHTVHAHMMPTKASPGGAFMEHTHESVPFDAKGQSSTHGDMLDHIAEHLGMGGEPKEEEAEGE